MEGKRKYNFSLYVVSLAFLALFWNKLSSADAGMIISVAAGMFPLANGAEHVAKSMVKRDG